MDSSFKGIAFDPSKCSMLSVEEKRELVYKISKWPHGASDILQTWSRQEILQILCAEMGKERKYTGLTKLKIIENLLKIVSEKKYGENEAIIDLEPQSSPALGPGTSKRQRKTDHPLRFPVSANNLSSNNGGCVLGNSIYCKNSACRATLGQENAFCKRCSCCICYQYDDNKDPSLWLICISEPPFLGNSCGMSCHLECALKHERSGINKDGCHSGLDGSFCCASCGKVNDLLGCWRKQLMTAKDTRRVDILCYRVSLSQKLLRGTVKYKKLYEIVDEAVKKLEVEVGPLTGLPVKMGRGIVNRLSSGPEVQKLCAFAVETLDSMLPNTAMCPLPTSLIQDSNSIAPNMVRFEDVHGTSLTVILGSKDQLPESIVNYSLWHRKACDMDYPAEPTCILFAPNTRFVVSGLSPATEYHFKAVSSDGTRELEKCEVRISTGSDEDIPNSLAIERSQSPATNCSSLSNPSSVEDESNNITPESHQKDNRADNYLTYFSAADKIVSAHLCNDAINCTVTGEGRSQADQTSLLGDKGGTGIVGCMPNSDFRKLGNKQSPEGQIVEEMSTDNGSDTPVQIGKECVPFVGSSEAELPITPYKLEISKDGLGRNGRSKSSNKDLENGTDSSSKKRSGEKRDEEREADGSSDRDFEYYVKLIRWLECEGHIEKAFRQKFLTWYSLRATTQEVRIVKVFVDTFIEDPASLAEQLVDTFSENISSKRASVVPAGFCMKLWH